jgi:hypothetical protein
LSADAVDAHARAPNPNIIAAQTLDFFILPPFSQPNYRQTSWSGYIVTIVIPIF